MLGKIQRWLQGIFETANMPTRRPQLDAHRESNIRGLYVIGDLAGAPVIKLAMKQGVEVIDHILQKRDALKQETITNANSTCIGCGI